MTLTTSFLVQRMVSRVGPGTGHWYQRNETCLEPPLFSCLSEEKLSSVGVSKRKYDFIGVHVV